MIFFPSSFLIPFEDYRLFLFLFFSILSASRVIRSIFWHSFFVTLYMMNYWMVHWEDLHMRLAGVGEKHGMAIRGRRSHGGGSSIHTNEMRTGGVGKQKGEGCNLYRRRAFWPVSFLLYNAAITSYLCCFLTAGGDLIFQQGTINVHRFQKVFQTCGMKTKTS